MLHCVAGGWLMSACLWSDFYTRAQLQRWYGAIAARSSCRAYQAAADIAQKSALNYAAERVCLPGVRIVLAPATGKHAFGPTPFSGSFSGVTDFAALIIRRTDPDAKLKAGISGEAFVLEACALGLGSCWVSAGFRRRRCGVALRRSERVAALIPFGIPGALKGPPGRSRKTLASLCSSDPVSWPYWAFRASEAVRMAPSARNRQPWRLSFSGNTLRLSSARFGQLDDGIAILHAQCAMAEIPHTWRCGHDGRSVLLSVSETDVPV